MSIKDNLISVLPEFLHPLLNESIPSAEVLETESLNRLVEYRLDSFWEDKLQQLKDQNLKQKYLDDLRANVEDNDLNQWAKSCSMLPREYTAAIIRIKMQYRKIKRLALPKLVHHHFRLPVVDIPEKNTSIMEFVQRNMEGAKKQFISIALYTPDITECKKAFIEILHIPKKYYESHDEMQLRPHAGYFFKCGYDAFPLLKPTTLLGEIFEPSRQEQLTGVYLESFLRGYRTRALESYVNNFDLTTFKKNRGKQKISKVSSVEKSEPIDEASGMFCFIVRETGLLKMDKSDSQIGYCRKISKKYSLKFLAKKRVAGALSKCISGVIKVDNKMSEQIQNYILPKILELETDRQTVQKYIDENIDND